MTRTKQFSTMTEPNYNNAITATSRHTNMVEIESGSVLEGEIDEDYVIKSLTSHRKTVDSGHHSCGRPSVEELHPDIMSMLETFYEKLRLAYAQL
jgi:hypothetical protein